MATMVLLFIMMIMVMILLLTVEKMSATTTTTTTTMTVMAFAPPIIHHHHHHRSSSNNNNNNIMESIVAASSTTTSTKLQMIQTGPNGKPASSKEEDLNLTIDIILNRFGATGGGSTNNNDDYKDAPKPLEQVEPPPTTTEEQLVEAKVEVTKGNKAPKKDNSQENEQEQQQQQKKKKKKNKKATDASSNSSSSNNDSSIDISKLDIRVGVIINAWEHPDAEKLYCEEIDIGETDTTGPRQIASGLRAHYASAEKDLIGRKVCVLANLKARKLVGFPSHGMVLCAVVVDEDDTAGDGTGKVVFVEPPETAQIGDRIICVGYDQGSPATENQMAKKKILEQVFPDLQTDENGIATYKGIPLTCGPNSEPCMAQDGLPNAMIC